MIEPTPAYRLSDGTRGRSVRTWNSPPFGSGTEPRGNARVLFSLVPLRRSSLSVLDKSEAVSCSGSHVLSLRGEEDGTKEGDGLVLVFFERASLSLSRRGRIVARRNTSLLVAFLGCVLLFLREQPKLQRQRLSINPFFYHPLQFDASAVRA